MGQQAQVSITGGAIISNSAKYGGGLYLSTGAVVTLTAPGAPALVNGNSATADGGGVYSSGGNVTLANSTLIDNLALGTGGAIFSDGLVRITNSLLKNNTGGDGGALYANSSQAMVTISNSTFNGNQAVGAFSG